MAPMKLFFADTETTGLDPAQHEIFQLAFLVEIDGKVVEEKTILFRPERPETISADALRITRKTKEELLSYPPKRQGYESLIAALDRWVDRYDKDDKLFWVGQNPRFDMDFLRVFFQELEDPYFGSWWHHVPADLIALAMIMRLRRHIDPPDFKLESLAQACGVPLIPHDALADVRATHSIWKKLLALIPLAEPAKSCQPSRRRP
ncbi:MAG TPA: hypothetical protein DD417_17765 [Elusimicrobia bacterium]|nr:hypothetical protein [Elusimicrobiota bacterium]